MKVYKFGGASVRSGDGVRNLARIAAAESGPLFVVVSAMGKTTNALEEVLAFVMENRRAEALQRFARVEACHRQIIRELFPEGEEIPAVERLCTEVRALVSENAAHDDYDRWYDRIVG